jgi:tetrahydromethanopterin S-methyltransferase subunit G
MEKKSENEIDEKVDFSSMNQLLESESHIFRNVLIGLLTTLLFGLGLIMIIATIFADACATKSNY